MLVRDIIDIDSTYEDFEALSDNDELKLIKKLKKIKKKLTTQKKMTQLRKKKLLEVKMTNLMFLLPKWKKKLSRR